MAAVPHATATLHHPLFFSVSNDRGTLGVRVTQLNAGRRVDVPAFLDALRRDSTRANQLTALRWPILHRDRRVYNNNAPLSFL